MTLTELIIVAAGSNTVAMIASRAWSHIENKATERALLAADVKLNAIHTLTNNRMTEVLGYLASAKEQITESNTRIRRLEKQLKVAKQEE
jgi:hypothetical protein